jgi:uncharacterized protein with FMN-binding domain
MRRITLWFLSTIAALVLLFSYRTSTQAPGSQEAVDASQARPAPVPTGGPAGDAAGGAAGGRADDRAGRSANDETAGAGSGSGSAGKQGGRAEAGRSGTFDGRLVQTSQGPVQVSITVADGRMTDIGVLASPSGSGHHEEINSRALPILRDEALQKQSADIDTVSGATATSGGYKQSLQAAIDAANL